MSRKPSKFFQMRRIEKSLRATAVMYHSSFRGTFKLFAFEMTVN